MKKCIKCGFVIVDNQGLKMSDKYSLSVLVCKVNKESDLGETYTLCPSCFDAFKEWVYLEEFKTFLDESCLKDLG